MSLLTILRKKAGDTVTAEEFNAILDALDSKYDADSLVNNLFQSTNGMLLDARQGKELYALYLAMQGGSGLSIAALDAKIAAIYAIVSSSTPDADNVVNTIQEMLAAFSQFPEGVSVLQALGLKANLDSPTFTGTPTGPTPANSDSSTRLATTAYVKSLISALPSVTGITYDVTTGTRDAVQSALDNAAAGKRIMFAPINYQGFTGDNPLQFKNKSGVTMDGGRGANFISTGGQILVFNGDNVASMVRGINFSSVANGGSGLGLILINEQGAQEGLEIEKCTFKAPNILMNAITASVYSVQRDGGSGLGKLTRKLRIQENDFDGIGRCAIELVNHSWDDNKTATYLKDLQINRNYFNDLGRKNETYDTSIYNGMAVSISGYTQDVQVLDNKITDAKLLGIELAGTDGAVVSNNIIRSPNNKFVGISVSDNQHSVTKNITVATNNIESRTKTISLNGVKEFNLVGNHSTQLVQTSDAGTVYIQNCLGGAIQGGSVNSMATNAIRLDDSSKVMVGGGMRVINRTNNFALVSIYGGYGSGSTYNKVGPDMYYEKQSGVATTGVVEAYGSLASNNSGVL